MLSSTQRVRLDARSRYSFETAVTQLLTRHSLVRSLGRESERLLEPLGIGRPYLRIDDAGRALAVERHDQLLGGDPAHIGAGLAGDARGVWARDHIVELQQRMIGRRRLLLPHVDPGAGDLLASQRLGQRALVVDEAACRRDEKG